MTAERWLRISIPIQGLLLLSQISTGLNADHISYTTYEVVHVGGGSLLLILVIIHVILNRDWLGKAYFGRRNSEKKG